MLAGSHGCLARTPYPGASSVPLQTNLSAAVSGRPCSIFGPSCLAGSCEALSEDIAAAQRPTQELQCPPGSDTERWSADECRDWDRTKICQASGAGLDGKLLVAVH